MDNNPRPPAKTYKVFLEPNAGNSAATASRQTHLRWQRLAQQRASREDDENRPLLDEEHEHDAASISDDVRNYSSPDRSMGLEYNSHQSPNREADSAGANSENRSLSPSLSDSDRSASDQSSSSGQDLDDRNMDIGDNNGPDDGIPEPHDALDDVLMFYDAGLTIAEVFTMIQALSLRHYLSDEATKGVLELVKMLAGPRFEHLNTSKFTMAQRFNPPEETISYVFYCSRCYDKLLGPVKKRDINKNSCQLCEQCDEVYHLNASSPNCFLSVDLECQIRSVLENPSIQPILLANLQLINERTQNDLNAHTNCDTHTGQVYRNIIHARGLENHQLVLTFNFSTDGAAWFHSSSKSGWPFQLLCNELPPKIRFRILFLAGLWISESEPNPQFMNLYMSIFVEQALKLMDSGIKVVSLTGEELSFTILFIHAIVDSVARPIMQNRLQFNGYSGCSWCYAHGEYYKHAMRYPVIENEPASRTHDEYLADIANAEALERQVRGVKGYSALISLPNFDCIWGFPIEYMHGALLGVTRQLWELWTRSGEPWCLRPRDQAEIDRRLLNIKPSKEIHRRPRSLKRRAKWKASEWRSWLLFWSIPCLTGVLRQDVLQSLARFVRSMYILLSEKVTEIELAYCEIDLITFVGECQIIFGKEAMTFNVHSLLHLVQSVRASGPLWSTSAFPFESGIYNLKRQIHGPKGINDQIVKGTLQMNIFQSRVASMPENRPSTIYCKSLFSAKSVESFVRIDNNLLVVGKPFHARELTLSVNGQRIDCIGELYHKCIYNGAVLHSIQYTKTRKTKDTVVELQCGAIAEISHLIVANETCYIQCVKLRTAPVRVEEVQVAHLLKIVGKYELDELLHITSVTRKAILIDVFESSYVSIPPNDFEVQ